MGFNSGFKGLKIKKHTQNVQCLLHFPGNSGYANAPQCYVVSTSPVLLPHTFILLSFRPFHFVFSSPIYQYLCYIFLFLPLFSIFLFLLRLPIILSLLSEQTPLQKLEQCKPLELVRVDSSLIRFLDEGATMTVRVYWNQLSPRGKGGQME